MSCINKSPWLLELLLDLLEHSLTVTCGYLPIPSNFITFLVSLCISALTCESPTEISTLRSLPSLVLENVHTAKPLWTIADCGENLAISLEDCLGEREPDWGEILNPSGNSQEKPAGMLLWIECTYMYSIILSLVAWPRGPLKTICTCTLQSSRYSKIHNEPISYSTMINTYMY